MFHRIITQNMRKCLDFNSRLLVRVQGHYAHNGLNIVWTVFLLKVWIGITFHRIVILDAWKYHELDPRTLDNDQVTIHIMVMT
jgi:hypothetical protein